MSNTPSGGLFTENKKKGSVTKKRLPANNEDQIFIDSSTKKRDQKHQDKEDGNVIASWAGVSKKSNGSGGPAWVDTSVEKLQVRIEDSSRLRKLKKEEAETQISGGQYEKRLQEHYEKMVGENNENDIFSWAKKI